LTVFPYSVENKRVYPGSRKELNFGVGFYNGYSSQFTVNKIKLFQEGTAVHNEIRAVFAFEDTDANGLFNPLLDNLLTEALFQNSYYTLDDLDLQLTPKKITYLFIAYDLALICRDSVSINLQLNSNEHITLSNASIEIQGEFPINSPGKDISDGMVTAQIKMDPSPFYQAALGEENVQCLAITIPANGAMTDILKSLAIQNGGTAAPIADISILKLWTERSGDPLQFNPADDRFVTFLTWNGNTWQNTSKLSEIIPLFGLRCYVTFNASNTATDGTTFIGKIPIGGIQVLSANDGPIDNIIENPFDQLISTDPLLTSIATNRSSYSIGQSIWISMRVRNTGETTLSGISPSLLGIPRSGTAIYQSGPSLDSFALPAKGVANIVWQYSATSAGDFEFCGQAQTGDSTKVSRQTCAIIDLQKKPQDIDITLLDLAPTSANRGQQNVPLFNISCDHVTSDSLVASILFDAIVLHFENPAGSPVAPNSIFNSITLVNPEGGQYNYSLVDSTANPVLLQLKPPIFVPAGGSVELDAFSRIANNASFISFRLSIETLNSIHVEDSNDSVLVATSSQQSFPWETNEININAPAELLLVSTPAPNTVYTNLAQDNVLAFDLHLLNNGVSVTASELLTHLTLSFYDTTGTAIPPSNVVRKLSLSSSEGIIYQSDDIPSADHRYLCNLKNPLLLQPQNERILRVLLDVKGLPLSDGFYLTVDNPLSLTVRDFNTGQLVQVVAGDTLQDFPLRSSTLIFQNPASGVEVTHVGTLPGTILPAQPSVPVMNIVLSHPDTVSASSVQLDSLAVIFLNTRGEPLVPGDYFSHMYVTNNGDTLSLNSALSSTLPMAALKISPPLLLTQSSSETLQVYLGTKNLYSPASFEARIEKEHIVLHDSNDHSRFYSIWGQFPLTSNLGTLQIPSNLALFAMSSKLPANITNQQSHLHVFDLMAANGNPKGSTDIELRRLTVRLDNNRGGYHTPTLFVAAAQVIKGDSIISQGQIDDTAITFLIPAVIARIPAGSADTLSILVDIETQAADDNIRFVIEAASSLDIRDAVTTESISAGTSSPAGFPLQSNFAHILSADAEKAFTNYPNPFAAGNDNTTITFYLESESNVTMKVYTIWGAHVIDLLSNKLLPAGLHQNIAWNGKNSDGDTVNNGVYYLVLKINGVHGDQRSLKRKVGVIR
ncbi:MAG: hypothetical protein ABIA59_01010, partial [Candidatus Latescibacterota bacterium]